MTLRLLIAALLFMFLFMGAGAIQPYLTPYFESNGIPSAKAGLALSLVYFSFAFMRFFSGGLIHYTGLKNAIIVASLIYGLFVLVVITASSFTVIAISAIVWGIGASFLWTAGSAYILNISKENRYGFSIGVQRLFVQSGTLIGFLVLAEVIHKQGKYRNGFIFCLFACLTGFILSFFLSRTDKRPDKINIKQAFRNVTSRQYVPFFIYLFTTGISYGFILNAVNRFIKAEYGYSAYRYTIVLYFLAGGFFTFLLGTFSDIKGRDAVIAWAFSWGIVSTVLTAASKAVVPLAISLFLFGAMFQVVNASVTAKIGDMSVHGQRPGIIAGVFLWRDMGIAIAILTAGFFPSSSKGLTTVCLLMVPFFVVSCLIAVYHWKIEARTQKSEAG